MKTLLLSFCCFIAAGISAQSTDTTFDPHKWVPPYTLTQDGWDIERFTLPPVFAPGFTYRGIEDIRFTKGWGKTGSSEYWSYAYVWLLDGKPVVNKTALQKNMGLYYDGLIGSNVEGRKIPKDKLFATEVSIQQTPRLPNDLASFIGTIRMLDYMKQVPITLNVILHQRICEGKDKTILLIEISPAPGTDPIWTRFKELWGTFACKWR